MSTQLPPLPADLPDLVDRATRALGEMGLDPEWAPTVVALATGEMHPKSMHCCGSGCRPCVQDILRCMVRVREAYHRGDSGGRSLAGRLFQSPVLGPFRGLLRHLTDRWGGSS